MAKQTLTLEKQLADMEKKSVELRKKIEEKNNANKPKSIIDRVKTFKDVLRIAKPTKEELAILNYKGKSKRLLFASHVMALSLISEVLNEGWLPKRGDRRWYVWFDVSSGFVFFNTSYVDTYANTLSASRLCLKNTELAEHSGKIFIQYHKNVIGF